MRREAFGVIRVRRAASGDAVSIAALATQVFLDTYATEGVRADLAREAFHEYSEGAFSSRIALPDRAFAVAELDQQGLAAFSEVHCAASRAPAGSIAGAELVRLYVQPRMQGRGLGRLVLSSAEAAAATCGLGSMWLTVWDGNARALAFYARLGYSDIGATTYSLQGRTYGNRVLAKQLVAA